MKKILLLTVMVVGLFAASIAQTRPITGKVIDKDGKPISGASITVKGTQQGVATEADGTYKINVKASDVLIISAVSFSSQQVKVGNSKTISVSLSNQDAIIDEVVVTAFGIKRQPKEIGYATQKVSGDVLTQGHVTNAATGLTGKVSGLQIQTTNNGVNPTVRINLRGNRSITGNNEALLVVDGAIVPSSYLSSIDPDDIDNITIIKGSEGSTLYGSEGSNGVMVVTTQKGNTRGKLRVKFSSNIQFERVSLMPDLQYDFGSYGGEGKSSGGIDPLTGKALYVPYENQSFGPRYDGSTVALGTPKRMYRADGSYYDSTLMVKYSPLRDAKKNFWDKGFTTQNNVSFSGGDEKSSIFVGLQNVYSEGIVPHDMFRKNNARVAGSRDFDKFKIEYSVSYTQSDVNTAGPGFFQSRPLYFAVLNTPAHVDLRWFQNTTDLNSFGNANNYFNAYYPNPWWQINNSRITGRDEYLIGNISAALKVTDWMDASYRIGYTSHEDLYKTTSNGVDYSLYEQGDPYGVSNLASSVKHTNPSMNEGNVFNSKLTGDLLVTLHKKFNQISTKLILGQNFQSDYMKFLGIGATALNFNNFFNIGTRVGSPTAYENDFQRNTEGSFAEATIGYKGYLFGRAAYRHSHYSTVSDPFSYGGADLSFIASDAFPKLFEGKFLDFVKVRASYGVTGQVNLDNISPFGAYNLQNTFATASNFPFGNTSGFATSYTLNNKGIKDERTTEIEVGAELGFLKNRINLQGAIYKSNTTNQTLSSQVSGATGYGTTLINNGETQNIGVESDLRFTPLLSTKDGFRWDIGINFNYIFNKVVALPGNADIFLGNSSYAIVGKAFPSLKVYDWARDAATGKVIVDDNGDPSRGSSLINVGSAFNPYRLGINTSLSYKNFTLAAVADYRGGGVIFNGIGQDLDFSGISAHSTYGNREKFVFPNSVYADATGKYVANNNRTISNVYNFWSGNINRIGTPYVTSASFWKLRELSLSYKLPEKLITASKYLKAATISVFGRNLLTFRPKDNIWTDPEFNDNATNAYGQSFNDAGFTSVNQTPPTRFWGFNIAVTF